MTTAAAHKALAPRSQTSGAALRSVVAMAAEVLTPCPKCGVTGPKRLLDEHQRRDHPITAAPKAATAPRRPPVDLPAIKPGGQRRRSNGGTQFVVGIDPRLRPRMEAERERSHRPFSQIIGAALDKYLRASP